MSVQHEQQRPQFVERAVTAHHRKRIRIALWLLLLGFAGVIFQLTQVHISPRWDLSQEEMYHIGQVTIQRPRGNIYDKANRLLATDRDIHSLSADPARIPDPELVAMRLAPLLDMDVQELEALLSTTGPDGRPKRFSWIKRYLTEREVSALGDLDEIAPKALHLEVEGLRFYPQGELAAHVLGFADRDGIGQEGLERTYNKYLSSKPGHRVGGKDRNLVLLPSLTTEYKPPEGGSDVHLTLDADMQHNLERELDAVLIRCKAEYAKGVMMDPFTGEIYALASRPAFDPNDYGAYEDGLRYNRAVRDVFEPGSSFKIVTASAALELGLVRPDTPVDCEGGLYYPYAGRRITDTHKMGVAPFSMCFAESSNIAMIKTAALLGPETMYEWMQRFGLGEATSRDFPMETKGMLWPLSNWQRASMVSLPMGQEVGVSMLQLARAFSVIANGGLLIEPHIVDRVVDAEGQLIHSYKPPAPRRILHEETARVMQELCHEVVTHGTGTYAHIPEYRVGGKTGTAQIARPKEEGGGYYTDRYNTVFAGFAPLAAPRICAVIVVHAPMIRLHYGGYVCGPVFRKVVHDALVDMGVPEDPVQVEVTVPPVYEPDADAVVARVDWNMMEPSVSDLLAPIELEQVQLAPRSEDIDPNAPRLPDFIGMTKREAREEVRKLNLPWSVRGSGWVVYQNPPAGTPLYDVSVCRLVFANERRDAEDAAG